MREIKFEYIFKSGKNIEKKIYDLELLEDLEMDIIALEKSSEIIARRQYIGLKDKNGKEIYEGDIVMGGMWFEYHYGTLELKFYKIDGFGNKRDEIDYYPWFNFGFNYDEGKFTSLEIIGNIYETPDLLSKN